MKKILFLLAVLPLLGASCQSSQPIACAYDGQRYEPGQSFQASDGCNTCSCGQDGQIVCTEIACPRAQGIDECQTDEDCLSQGIDTSFCADGQWACVNAQCEFQCSLNGVEL